MLQDLRTTVNRSPTQTTPAVKEKVLKKTPVRSSSLRLSPLKRSRTICESPPSTSTLVLHSPLDSNPKVRRRKTVVTSAALPTSPFTPRTPQLPIPPPRSVSEPVPSMPKLYPSSTPPTIADSRVMYFTVEVDSEWNRNSGEVATFTIQEGCDSAASETSDVSASDGDGILSDILREYLMQYDMKLDYERPTPQF